MSNLIRIGTTVVASLALACVLACGDDGHDHQHMIDAASAIDAGAIDAAAADASTANACTTLCTCASTYCSQTMQDCMTECAGLPASVRACRITHCGYAQQPGGASTHCPHVAGDLNDQTTPAECKFDQDAGL